MLDLMILVYAEDDTQWVILRGLKDDIQAQTSRTRHLHEWPRINIFLSKMAL